MEEMEQVSAASVPKDSVDEEGRKKVAVKDEDSQDLVIDEADYELDENGSGSELSSSVADSGIDAEVETNTQTIQPDFSNSGIKDENNRSKKHMRKMPHILRSVVEESLVKRTKEYKLTDEREEEVEDKENAAPANGEEEAEKRHRCEECGERFKYKGNLKRHILTHTGEKPFPCDLCDQSFTRKEHMETHRRIHTGEKPYVCEMCSMAFSDKTGLRSHMKKH